MCGSSAGCVLDEKLHGYPPGERNEPHNPNQTPPPRTPASFPSLVQNIPCCRPRDPEGGSENRTPEQMNLENTVS